MYLHVFVVIFLVVGIVVLKMNEESVLIFCPKIKRPKLFSSCMMYLLFFVSVMPFVSGL